MKNSNHYSLSKCLNFNGFSLELEFSFIKIIITYHALDRALLFHHKRFSNFKCHQSFYSLCLKDLHITLKFYHETSSNSINSYFTDSGVKGPQKKPMTIYCINFLYRVLPIRTNICLTITATSTNILRSHPTRPAKQETFS